jgi:hypothetical protein
MEGIVPHVNLFGYIAAQAATSMGEGGTGRCSHICAATGIS